MKTKNRENEKIPYDVRIFFEWMVKGNRIRLKDGRIGSFKGYDYKKSRNTFLFEENGTIESVRIDLYDCTLVRNPELQCPVCQSHIIMDGVLRSNNAFPKFVERTASMIELSSYYYNSSPIILHACRDCGYVMPFLQDFIDIRRDS